ncbi:MAG: hypothetical protein N3A66_09610, partial [Planctomycetota bacterium]|nr:hypothetical protein [Planctomycetota bacterium]
MKKHLLILCAIYLLSSAAWAQEGEDFHRAGQRLIADAKKFFAGCENRFAGSAGNLLATERVAERFAAAPHSGRLFYETAVFVPGEAHLLVDRRQIALQPLLPNGADPCAMPTSEYEGEIVYAGRGEIEEIEGKSLAGALVLFEFDCGLNYLEAVKRGAAACLFIAPAHFAAAEAYAKILAAPLSIPRFQVAREDADTLRRAAAAGQRALLHSVAGRWERRELSNLWALVEGADPERRRELVVLYANLD